MAAEEPPSRRSFSARLRLLRNKRYEDWFYIVIGGPIAITLTAFIADVKWITPNRLTMLGFTIRLAALPLIVLDRTAADLWAAAAIMTGAILDAMDGSLARYRKAASPLGAFLDKVTDAIGIAAFTCVLGWRAWHDSGSLLLLYAGAAIGILYMVRLYMHWIVAYFELERGIVKATTGPRAQRPYGDLGFSERLVDKLRQSWRILLMGEGDIFLWSSIALIVDAVPIAVGIMAGFAVVLFVGVFGLRLAAVLRLERG